jgi:hypothetical protein
LFARSRVCLLGPLISAAAQLEPLADLHLLIE